MLNSRDALQLLLEEAQDEELLLRDYVMWSDITSSDQNGRKRRSHLRRDLRILAGDARKR